MPIHRQLTGAAITTAANLNLDSLAVDALGHPRSTRHPDLEIRHALDTAALHTNKMRMLVPLGIGVDSLKAPDVITDIGAARETGIDKRDQTAIDRRRLKTIIAKRSRNLLMRHRALRRPEQAQDRETCGRHPQSHSLEFGALGVMLAGLHGSVLPQARQS